MENETEKNTKNMLVPICITQTICVVIILIAVLIIKFFFGTTYNEIEKWHNENFLQETTISNFDEEKT